MVIKNQNILVTGGTGFIGSHLVKKLTSLGAHVTVPYISIDPKSYFVQQKLDQISTPIFGDVCDIEKMKHITARKQIEIIIHLAAQTLVDVAYTDPRITLKSNIMGTVNILEIARLNNNIKGVIIASSDKAYGKSALKYKEKHSLKGDHPYEVSKSAADLIANAYHKTYDLPVVITRFGNVYGEGDLNFSRIVPGILTALIQKKVLLVRSNGKYRRDYIYVKDVIEGYLAILKNFKIASGSAFNFSTAQNLSVLELIRVTEKVIGKKVKYKILNQAKNEIPYQSLNWQKAKKTLNWSPSTKLESAIGNMFSWYKSKYFLT